MNTRYFLLALGIIIFIIAGYLFYTSRKPLEPEGSLTNVELSPTSASQPEATINSTTEGLH